MTRRGGTLALWRIGWVALIVLTGLLIVMHVPGIWFYSGSADEQQMFEVFGWLHLFGLVVLLIPYRRRERWAWWLTWAGIVPVALVPLFAGPPASVIDAVTAALMVLAQLATLPGFHAQDQATRQAVARK